MEAKLEKKVTNKLDKENSNLNMENVNWFKRPNLVLSFVLRDFKC